MKRILFSLLVATLPFGSVLADERKEKNAKVSLVYEHELPNVPGKSLRAVLVEYGPGGGSPSHRHPSSAFIYARVLEGAIRSKVTTCRSVLIKPARAGSSSRVIITRLARMPVPRLRRSCLPYSWSTQVIVRS